MNSARTLTLTFSLMVTQGLAGQQLPEAQLGSQIRVTIAGGSQRLKGQYLRHTGTAVHLRWFERNKEALEYPIELSDIVLIEIGQGKRYPHVKYTLVGAAMGAGFGLLAGKMAASFGPEEAKGILVIMTGVGAVFGAVRAQIGVPVWVPGTVRGWRPPPR